MFCLCSLPEVWWCLVLYLSLLRHFLNSGIPFLVPKPRLVILGCHNKYYRLCSGLDVCVVSKGICWNSNFHCVGIGGGVFGKWLDLKDKAFMNWISDSVKGIPESLSPSFCHVSIQEVFNPEEGPHQNPTMLAPWSQIPSLQNQEMLSFCFLQAICCIALCYSTPDYVR